MKKKILFISNNFWPENFRSNDVVNLISSNYEVSVLTGYPTYPTINNFKNMNFNDEDFTKSSFNLIRVPTLKKTYNKLSTFFNYVSFIFSGFLVGTFLLKEKKFDYIICFASSPIYQSLLSIWFSKVKKGKSILWIQDIWPETLIELGYVKNKYLIKLLNNSVNYLYRKHDLILTQSIEYYSYLNKDYKKCNFLFNPSDQFEDESKKPESINFDKKFRYIVYTGNIGEAQNFDLLLKAALLLKSYSLKFLLIGNGSKFNKIKNEIQSKDLPNIEIYESISKRELAFVLKNSDILFISLKKNKISKFIIPSKFQTYTFYGKPILCQTDGDVKKIVLDYGCGFVLKDETLDNMVHVLKNIIISNKQELDNMGKNSKFVFDKYFNNDVFLDNFKRILNET